MKRALVSLSFLGLGLLAGACSAEPAPCFEGPSITLDLTAIGAATGAPIAGAELCATHPRSCSCTRASASGRASLEVPAEADVGLRFSHESHYAIALQLTSGTEDLGGRVPMLTHSDTELVSLFTGMNLDPERGTVL
ncbi:MAG: hypothetical protein OEY14_11015, partial [Myxococcales bacterium]|nr:hypothetical protein [Myxococcales bacterium]